MSVPTAAASLKRAYHTQGYIAKKAKNVSNFKNFKHFKLLSESKKKETTKKKW